MVTPRKTLTTSEFGRNVVSQHDQEVEKRLLALEQKAHTPCGNNSVSEERITALESKLEQVIAALKIASPGSTKKL